MRTGARRDDGFLVHMLYALQWIGPYMDSKFGAGSTAHTPAGWVVLEQPGVHGCGGGLSRVAQHMQYNITQHRLTGVMESKSAMDLCAQLAQVSQYVAMAMTYVVNSSVTQEMINEHAGDLAKSLVEKCTDRCRHCVIGLVTMAVILINILYMFICRKKQNVG